MANSKTVHVVHAPDADMSIEKLKIITERLRQEHRIDKTVFLTSDSIVRESFRNLGAQDVVIVILTEDVVVHKPLIEDLLLKVKDENSGVGIVEIIDHNVVYEPSFLAFPSNLKPIASQENKDVVWSQIETSLKEILPIPTPIEKETWWEKNKKMALYGIGFIVLAGLLYAIGTSDIFGEPPIAKFAYLVKDPLNEEPISTAGECYIPCRVYLTDQSTNAETLKWDLKDTLIENTTETQFVFKNPGEYVMVLTAKNGDKEDRKEEPLFVKAPPKAGFEIKNNGCTAPCEVTFKNTSVNATKFSWSFPGAASQVTSTNESPGSRTYNSRNRYNVTLKVENEDGITSESSQTITILQDDSPFADFTYRKLTNGYPVNQIYQFTNQSQNASSYIWEISKVGVANIRTYNTKEPRHTFSGYGVYNVKLLVRNSTGRTSSTFKQLRIRDRGLINPNLTYLRAAERVMHTNIIVPQGGNN